MEAVVVNPVNPDQPGSSISLTALLYEGSLEEVNERGIVESFTSEIEVLAANTFYPWAAGLFTRLIETNNSFQAINRPGRSIRRRLFGTLLWVIEADQGDDR